MGFQGFTAEIQRFLFSLQSYGGNGERHGGRFWGFRVLGFSSCGVIKLSSFQVFKLWGFRVFKFSSCEA